ncbi:peptidylprolyl isomerase [Limnochorda pilosa]|uniref:peptidylprolyl isomerase n=1 Tax=Limnochorda pilosa TaxID=1555112 RepID=A0A0K2SRJ7_LIMPI|nr:peptidylprolyl isomerase [Limnochorda pilosa]BAS29439.1 foldase [Limnochorda pilosa]
MVSRLRDRRLAWWGVPLVLLLILALARLVPWARAAGEGDVVARVNGEPIARDAFYAALERAAGEQVLDQLITEALILQASPTLKEPVADADVEKEIASLKAAYPDEKAFQAALDAYRLDEEELARQVRLSLIVDRLSSQDVSVTDEEVAQYFESHKDELAHPERVRARHILVKTLEEAQAVKKALDEGGDFARLAAERSQDPGSKAKGGDVGFFSQSDNLVDSFKEAAFALDVNEISDPVKSSFGYHIIQVTEREAARPAKLEEEAAQIRDQLVQEKATPPAELIGNLRSGAEITVLWDRYRSLQNTDPGASGGAD